MLDPLNVRTKALSFQVIHCGANENGQGWQSCNEYVALNPDAFSETYWEVNYLKVYQVPAGVESTSTSSLSSVTPAISTSDVSTALSNAQGRTSTHTSKHCPGYDTNSRRALIMPDTVSEPSWHRPKYNDWFIHCDELCTVGPVVAVNKERGQCHLCEPKLFEFEPGR